MFILAQFFQSLSILFDMIFSILYFLLVARIIISWFQVNPYNEIVQIIMRITEPILAPFRRLPLRLGVIDFSPILAFIAITFLRSFVVGILRQLAMKLAG
ncbi:MAG: YggT family protein [Candidatus Omnitrophica bacterium]|nr:YggT family protein [Candidatus Omnitrophota bacterium]MCK4423204.1 YggT family protein [Candidatus Omnitrophota bacterium]